MRSARYREKKKATDANYMTKERERKRKAYVPVDLLFHKRRKFVNLRVKKHYAKNRRVKESPVIPAVHDIPNIRSKGRKLCVALAFKGMKKNDALRKRHSMALKNAYREIANLRQKNFETKFGPPLLYNPVPQMLALQIRRLTEKLKQWGSVRRRMVT